MAPNELFFEFLVGKIARRVAGIDTHHTKNKRLELRVVQFYEVQDGG